MKVGRKGSERSLPGRKLIDGKAPEWKECGRRRLCLWNLRN